VLPRSSENSFGQPASARFWDGSGLRATRVYELAHVPVGRRRGLSWEEGVSRGAGVDGGVVVIRSGTLPVEPPGVPPPVVAPPGGPPNSSSQASPSPSGSRAPASESNASWASSRSAKPCPLGMR
jgi:hypothetical protein